MASESWKQFNITYVLLLLQLLLSFFFIIDDLKNNIVLLCFKFFMVPIFQLSHWLFLVLVFAPTGFPQSLEIVAIESPPFVCTEILPCQPVILPKKNKSCLYGGIVTRNAGCVHGYLIDLLSVLSSPMLANFSFNLWLISSKETGGYNGLVSNIFDQSTNDTLCGPKHCDMAIGDITINWDRRSMNNTRFSTPYMDVGLQILARVDIPTLSLFNLDFMLPFTSELWVLILCTLIYVTFAIVFIEAPKFRAKFFYCHQGENLSWQEQSMTRGFSVTETAWFVFQTMFSTQDTSMAKTKLSRGLVICWMATVLLLTASYTAQLTAYITSNTFSLAFPGLRSGSSAASSLNEASQSVPLGLVVLKGGNTEEYLTGVVGIDPTNLRDEASLPGDTRWERTANLLRDPAALAWVADETSVHFAVSKVNKNRGRRSVRSDDEFFNSANAIGLKTRDLRRKEDLTVHSDNTLVSMPNPMRPDAPGTTSSTRRKGSGGGVSSKSSSGANQDDDLAGAICSWQLVGSPFGTLSFGFPFSQSIDDGASSRMNMAIDILKQERSLDSLQSKWFNDYPACIDPSYTDSESVGKFNWTNFGFLFLFTWVFASFSILYRIAQDLYYQGGWLNRILRPILNRASLSGFEYKPDIEDYSTHGMVKETMDIATEILRRVSLYPHGGEPVASNGTSETKHSSVQEDANLPPGWIKRYDHNRVRFFYINTEENKIQWTRPTRRLSKTANTILAAIRLGSSKKIVVSKAVDAENPKAPKTGTHREKDESHENGGLMFSQRVSSKLGSLASASIKDPPYLAAASITDMNEGIPNTLPATTSQPDTANCTTAHDYPIRHQTHKTIAVSADDDGDSASKCSVQAINACRESSAACRDQAIPTQPGHADHANGSFPKSVVSRPITEEVEPKADERLPLSPRPSEPSATLSTGIDVMHDTQAGIAGSPRRLIERDTFL